ncbi:MAG: hypothetical protein U0231_09380 [Nitrospiraceae bacterium]
MNQDQVSVAPHESLLWGQGIQRARPRWMRALWKSCSACLSVARFVTPGISGAIGQGKAQAVGFVRELAFRTPMSRLQN